MTPSAESEVEVEGNWPPGTAQTAVPAQPTSHKAEEGVDISRSSSLSSIGSMDDGDDRSHRDSTGKGARKQSTIESQATSKSGPTSWFHIGNNNFKAAGKVSRSDGRLKLSVHEIANKGYVAKALGVGLNGRLGAKSSKAPKKNKQTERIKHAIAETDNRSIPKLNIVVMVIGSRGDIQPFIKIGRILRDDFGHRVRIATHPAFKDFVEKECGLEHFDVGGNPSELMAFMVKNPGLMPSFQTLKEGEVGRRRKQMAEMFEGFWRSCIEANDGAHDDSEVAPFVADAIISNPPVMIHVHIAERLGCPLHIMFTFPYTPTQAFPHPLANIKTENLDEKYTNFVSYPLVELMTWSGLGDLVNDCRAKCLHLDPVSTIWAPGNLYRQQVPFTYLWSPALVPKPRDWGSEINIAGYVFLEKASDFQPSKDLTDFLDAGDSPVYIGFGSIVVDEPKKFTSLIFDAVKKAGIRALVNKGWGGIGTEGQVPQDVFMLDNVPHDWLFPRCKAVVHHGGAGTTAIGLKCAKPTVIVPFFGDQPFWGNMIAAAKAGAHECIPYRRLTADKLAELIKQCFSEESQRNVQQIADQISTEGDGAHNAVKFFHESLPFHGTHSLRGSVLEEQAAAWRIRKSSFRLSPVAAELMVQEKKLSYDDLRLLRVHAWTDFQGPGTPLSGAVGAIFRSGTGLAKGASAAPTLLSKDMRTELQRQKMKHRSVKDEAATGSKLVGNGHDAERATGHESMDTLKEGTRTSNAASHASDIAGPTSKDVARHASYGITKPLSVIAQAPMELLLGVGQGFHNAPRLYGDDTVRRPLRISGLKSGLHAAGHEFTYQSYDAWTGIFTQTYKAIKDDGAKGAVTGFGKGVGGLVLKSSAAVVNPLGLAMKGVERQVTKSKSPVPRIREARIAQGQRAVMMLTEEERAEASLKVNNGLLVMRDLWKQGDEMKKSGWTGRYQYRKEKNQWVDYGALESAAMAKMAMEARGAGIPFETFMESHRKQIERDMKDPELDERQKRQKGWWGSEIPTRQKKDI